MNDLSTLLLIIAFVLISIGAILLWPLPSDDTTSSNTTTTRNGRGYWED